MLRVRSSRRAAGLKPADYDHEISLVDHDGAPIRRDDGGGNAGFDRVSTESRLLPSVGEGDQPSSQPSPRIEDSDNDGRIEERPRDELEREEELPHPALRPSIEIQSTSDACLALNSQTVDLLQAQLRKLSMMRPMSYLRSHMLREKLWLISSTRTREVAFSAVGRYSLLPLLVAWILPHGVSDELIALAL